MRLVYCAGHCSKNPFGLKFKRQTNLLKRAVVSVFQDTSFFRLEGIHVGMFSNVRQLPDDMDIVFCIMPSSPISWSCIALSLMPCVNSWRMIRLRVRTAHKRKWRSTKTRRNDNYTITKLSVLKCTSTDGFEPPGDTLAP